MNDEKQSLTVDDMVRLLNDCGQEAYRPAYCASDKAVEILRSAGRQSFYPQGRLLVLKASLIFLIALNFFQLFYIMNSDGAPAEIIASAPAVVEEDFASTFSTMSDVVASSRVSQADSLLEPVEFIRFSEGVQEFVNFYQLTEFVPAVFKKEM